MAEGTYSELQQSGLDIVSLMRTEEEQERRSRSADPDRLSLQSQRTAQSHSSHCSHSSLLPPESSCAQDLPVGSFFKIKSSLPSISGALALSLYLKLNLNLVDAAIEH